MPRPDCIEIEGLRAHTVVGVHPEERLAPREVMIDLRIEPRSWLRGRTSPRPGESDDLADAIDYDEVCRRIVDGAAGARFQLIEALAESLARTLLEEFPIARLRLRLEKPGAVECARSIAVVIHREASHAEDSS